MPLSHSLSSDERKRLRRVLMVGHPICYLCGDPDCIDYSLGVEDRYDDHYPTIDHIIPTSQGGTDDISNLKMAGRKCNISRNKFEGPKNVIKKLPGFNW